MQECYIQRLSATQIEAVSILSYRVILIPVETLSNFTVDLSVGLDLLQL